MNVHPEQIIIGAGTEYLYTLIIQLLGRDKTFAVEDPGYEKIRKIYNSNNVKCVSIPIDEEGVNIDALKAGNADILHLSPSHHYPTGINFYLRTFVPLVSLCAIFIFPKSSIFPL